MAASSNTRYVNDRPSKNASSNPAIVVAAYNRPASLLRLLKGLQKAHYPKHPVPLHISIDQSYAPDVAQVAHDFDWPYGPKEVVIHREHLGLRTHLLQCGDLTARYGAIILLEDDLYVSPEFYRFARSAIRHYTPDPKIAGISLYHYECAESTQLPFRPLEDGNDFYFIQWPSSWGLVVTDVQWGDFRKWLGKQLNVGDEERARQPKGKAQSEGNVQPKRKIQLKRLGKEKATSKGITSKEKSETEGINESKTPNKATFKNQGRTKGSIIGKVPTEGPARDQTQLKAWLPEFVQSWEIGSWKRLFVAYLRAKDLYFVYPRISLSTHFGEPGPHTILKGFQQSPLLSQPKEWVWIDLAHSRAVYDAWFEIFPENLKTLQPDLEPYNFTVDLYGMKEAAVLNTDYVLTSRWVAAELQEQADQVPLKYSMELLPVVQNVISGLEGHDLFLVRRDALDLKPASFQHYIGNLPGWSKRLVEKGVSGDLLRISIVVPESSHSPEAEATIASILKQERAQIEVIALVRGELEPSPDDRVRVLAWPEGMGYWETLETGMRAASGDLLIWMHPGVVLQTGVLEQVEAIMHQYREVNWLLMRPDAGTKVAGQRWTQDRFGRVAAEAIRKGFGPGTSVWRRGFWQSLGKDIQGGEDLTHRAFEKGLPYAADLVGMVKNAPAHLEWGPNLPERKDHQAKRTMPGRVISKLARPFFLRNGALRWIHQEIEHYPPVIRFDAELGRWEMQRF